MKKFTMQTPNLTDKNIARIAALFPNVITEMEDENGKLKKGVNFELLRQELSGDIVESGEECYDFTWVGKKQAILEGNMPIRKTLRPCKEESKNWETTENLYIEGDNLDVLKLLQESYLNKVKMIYIDPPYNTGNDFVYKDDFAMSREEYEDQIGLYDDEDNRLFRNTETNGRFHSDWCSMLYPRLKLAHNLLTEDGVIFISIDDNEVHNLRKMCDEVFGASGFLATFVWKRRTSSALDQSKCSTDHEYVLAYKMEDFIALRGTDKDYKGYSNPDNDPRGPWTTGDLTVGMTADMRPNQFYDLVDPKTGYVYKPNYNRVWSYIPESMERLIQEDRIVFPKDTTKRPMRKRFASELNSEKNPQSTWLEDIGLNTEATRQMNVLFGKAFFNYTKPQSLMKSLILQATDNNAIILDFFSGSATTAHAVMQINAEDGGNRKFIMVQMPEKCDENSEAYKAGFKTIAEIGKERIRRAGEQIRKEIEENAQQLKMGEEPKKVPDIGFRVLKVDSTNMKDVYYSADQYSQQMLDDMISNIKEDRTDMDLLYQVLLDWGLALNLKHQTEVIEGVSVHTVDGDALMACFDDNVPESVVREMAKRRPLRAVFRDSSFADSPSKINVEEIFKMNAPGTDVRVI